MSTSFVHIRMISDSRIQFPSRLHLIVSFEHFHPLQLPSARTTKDQQSVISMDQLALSKPRSSHRPKRIATGFKSGHQDCLLLHFRHWHYPNGSELLGADVLGVLFRGSGTIPECSKEHVHVATLARIIRWANQWYPKRVGEYLP